MSNIPSSRSFRIIASSSLAPMVEEFLHEEGYRFQDEPFSPLCKKLLAEPAPLGSSLAAFFGYIYIQDRSSMLPPLALAPEKGSAALDISASPGSKTGFLAQLVAENGFVLGNELNSKRLTTLRQNLRMANLLQTGTCKYDGAFLPLMPASWRSILLDPPCSGWGTIAKNPSVKEIWRGKNLSSLIALQRQLLIKAYELLAPGGKLLYSTCTTNPDENEHQTAFAINELGLTALPLAPFPGFTFDPVPNGALLVNGAASNAQGFYLSLLQKNPDQPVTNNADNFYSFREINRSELASPVCDPALLPKGICAQFGDRVYFLPEKAQTLIPNGFNWKGFLLGKRKRGRFIADCRLRRLLPAPDSTNSLEFENIDEIRKLLAGTTIFDNKTTSELALWWRGLPLCIAQNKNGRIMAAFN